LFSWRCIILNLWLSLEVKSHQRDYQYNNFSGRMCLYNLVREETFPCLYTVGEVTGSLLAEANVVAVMIR